jgi:hypothetical protein
VRFGFVPSPSEQQLYAAEGYLTPALQLFGHTWRECLGLIETGHAQLWMSDEAALVSRNDGETLEIWACGGRVVNASDQFLAVIEQAAREHGFARMRISGRKGWARHLAKWGWVQQGDDVIKELKNG